MFFHKSANIDGILELIKPKLAAVLNSASYMGLILTSKTMSKPAVLNKTVICGEFISILLNFGAKPDLYPTA